MCRAGRAGGTLRDGATVPAGPGSPGRPRRCPGGSRLSGEGPGAVPAGLGSPGKVPALSRRCPGRSRFPAEAPPGPGAASGAAAAVPGGGAGAMGVTRQKHAKKIMGFYKHNFQFREPFQVLLDGTFCQAALRNKIQIREQLPGYLDGAAQLCTTRYGGSAPAGRGRGEVALGLRVTCRRVGAALRPPLPFRKWHDLGSQR